MSHKNHKDHLQQKKSGFAQTTLELKGETVKKPNSLEYIKARVLSHKTHKDNLQQKKRAGCSDHARVERRNSEEALTHLNI